MKGHKTIDSEQNERVFFFPKNIQNAIQCSGVLHIIEEKVHYL